MDLKNNLKEIRMKEYMMEPGDFAELLEVNVKTYYSWEKGGANPNLKKAHEVCEIIKKDMKEVWYLE